jgi:hypothetical protein
VLMVVVSILHLHYPAAAQTDALRTILENLMSSRCSILQSAACGGLLRLLFSLLATRTFVSLRHSVM